MTAQTSAALPAFLRGLERRARTLAEAQCGDAHQAAAIWTDTAATFAEHAASAPVASWPVLFWSRLVGHPALAKVTLPAESPLAALGPGPRAALLLRLVAGLDPRPAAQVLGVTEPTYRFALQRALEQARAAGIDADALRRLREAWQRQPAPAPPERPVFAPASAAAPVAELQADPEPTEPAHDLDDALQPVPPRPARPRTRWIVAAVAVIGAAVVAWRFWPAPPAPLPRPEVLAPPTDTPALPPLVTHPDYALIAGADDEALARDMAFLSWIAATNVASGDAPQTAPTAPAPAPGGTP